MLKAIPFKGMASTSIGGPICISSGDPGLQAESTRGLSLDMDDMEDVPEECLYFMVDIDRAVPLEYALPLYGFVMPLLVLFTTAINSFIVLVLSQKHLRTPTNFVLLSMALADLLTGLSSVPWFLFYYTLRGYEQHRREGLPSFWCLIQPILSQIVPTIWHTAAIWLGVFLAVQRYVYVCVPSQVHRFCTPGKAKKAVLAVVLCSLLTELPELFGKRMERVRVGPEQHLCLLRYSAWVRHGLGVDLFFSLHYWFRVALVHALPCLLLLVFTLALTRTIKKAQLRRRSWTANGGLEQVACAAAAVEEERSPHLLSPPGEPAPLDGFTLKKSATWGGGSPNLGPFGGPGVAGGSANGGGGGGGRSLDSTNRMLAAICSVFLLIELPAAFIFTLHLLIATGIVPKTAQTYRVLNVTLIIRNLLIVLTSPLQFGIYCSMSEQFRLTVRQLFSASPLFVAQAQPSNYHGGKRYSLILVDVEQLRRQQQQQQADLPPEHNLPLQPAANNQPSSSPSSYFLIDRRRHLSLQAKQNPQQKDKVEGSQRRRLAGEHWQQKQRTAHRKHSAPAGQHPSQCHQQQKQQLGQDQAEEEEEVAADDATSAPLRLDQPHL